jgi:hypothetical protein
MTRRSSYYDINAILAEEERIPCRTRFHFSHLSHLDPELAHRNQHRTTFLPENTKLEMPLWAVDKWANSNYVHISIPRHYNRRTRERIEAEPMEFELR